MPGEDYKDPDTLERLYWEEDLTTHEMGKRLGCNNGSISYWMEKHGIPRRDKGEARREHDDRLYDEDSLRELYHEKGLTTYEVADELGCSQTTVREWMDKHGVDSRDLSEACQTEVSKTLSDSAEVLEEMYHGEGMTVEEIAGEFDTTYTTVYNWLKRHGIETRSAKESRDLRGTNHYPEREWPGDDPEWLREKYYEEGLTLKEMAEAAGLESGVTILRYMEDHGIERRTAGDYLRKDDAIRNAKHDNHDQIRFGVNGKTHYYDIHRIVAIGEFGLDEVAGSIVHHKNGIPWDNRPDNLELIESQSEHAKMHYKEREIDDKGRFV